MMYVAVATLAVALVSLAYFGKTSNLDQATMNLEIHKLEAQTAFANAQIDALGKEVAKLKQSVESTAIDLKSLTGRMPAGESIFPTRKDMDEALAKRDKAIDAEIAGLRSRISQMGKDLSKQKGE